MECRDALPLLSELRLGEIPPERAAALERHVAACASCRARSLATAEAIAALTHDAAMEIARPVPRTDLATVLPSSARPRRAAFARRPWLAWAARFAALVLAGAGGAAAAHAFGAGRELREVPLLVDAQVRREVETTLSPMLRDVASWITASEERHARELGLIARWLDERRVDDAAQLARALAATRADLEATQEAVFAVAHEVPIRVPLPSPDPVPLPR